MRGRIPRPELGSGEGDVLLEEVPGRRRVEAAGHIGGAAYVVTGDGVARALGLDHVVRAVADRGDSLPFRQRGQRFGGRQGGRGDEPDREDDEGDVVGVVLALAVERGAVERPRIPGSPFWYALEKVTRTRSVSAQCAALRKTVGLIRVPEQ